MKLGKNHFLPSTFQCVFHCSSSHPTPYSDSDFTQTNAQAESLGIDEYFLCLAKRSVACIQVKRSNTHFCELKGTFLRERRLDDVAVILAGQPVEAEA
jgi:hypothetical protein